MRYAIGVEIEDKKSKDKYSGLYVVGDFGFPGVFVSGESRNADGYTIDIYDDIEAAKKKVSILARAFRRDDVAFSKGKSRKIRRFYPVKVDSPKFPVVLKKEDKAGTERKKNEKAYTFSDKYGGSGATDRRQKHFGERLLPVVS